MEQNDIKTLQDKAKESIKDFEAITKELKSTKLNQESVAIALEQLTNYTETVKDINKQFSKIITELSQIDIGKLSEIEKQSSQIKKIQADSQEMQSGKLSEIENKIEEQNKQIKKIQADLQAMAEQSSLCLGLLSKLRHNKPRWFN